MTIMDIEEKKKEKKCYEEGDQVLIKGERIRDMGWGYRHQQTVLLFFCITVAYSMRSCMGVALVAMTESYTVNNMTYKNENDTREVFDALLFMPPYPKFQWEKKTQDVIQASFFWGYMILQIPSGLLAHKYGTRYLLTGAMMVNCVMSFGLPWAAYYGGWTLAMMCRIIQGLSQSCILPSTHTAFGKWTPLEERGRLAAFAYGGQALGMVLGMPITGFISASTLGWPGIFRFYGIVSGLMAALLWWLLADSPAQHKSISSRERRYIEEALNQSGQNERLPVPWKRMLTHPGMIAIVVAHISHTWGHVTLYSEVPAFMAKIMKVNIKANGILSALPFFMMWLANFIFSYVTDMLIVRKILSVTHTRKFANTMGTVPPALGLIVLAYVKKDIYIVESILIIICVFKTSLNSGFQINHIDIAPKFAGTMYSISNFVSNSVSSLAPIVAGVILTDVNSEDLWRKVFYVSAGLFLFTNLFYVIFGTAELADWNEPKKRKDEENLMLRHKIDK